MEESGLSVNTSDCHGDEEESLEKTVPTLPPEMWEEIFGHLPSIDLQTVINTSLNWNKLLASKKPSMLFPKVLECMSLQLSREDALVCRLVNRECKVSVDAAVPEIVQRIRSFEERERLQRSRAFFEEIRRNQDEDQEMDVAELRLDEMLKFLDKPFRKIRKRYAKHLKELKKIFRV